MSTSHPLLSRVRSSEPSRASRPPRRRVRWLGVASAVAASVLLAPSAAHATSQQISSPGPLASVAITDTLNCAVDYIADTHGEFFDDTACGTFLAFTDGGRTRVAGPASIPAGGRFDSSFAPVSQTRGGSGTFSDPFTITTVADAVGDDGTHRIRLSQIDSYIVGENAYRTTTTASSLDGAAHDLVIYKGADCYLGDSDLGYGDYDAATGAVTCKNSTAADARISQLVPLTDGSNYLYANFALTWGEIRKGLPLADRLDIPDSRVDNGMALSWSTRVAPGQTSTVSHLTNFSPTNLRALPTSITASPDTTAPGGEVTLSVDVSNASNATAVVLRSLTLTLPSGASYITGSTTGSRAEPTQHGTALTIPIERTIAGGGHASVQLRVALTQTGDVTVDGLAELAPVLSSSTRVSVAVAPAPAPPRAIDDAVTTDYETPLHDIDVLGNDVGAGLQVTGVGTTADGTARLEPSGRVSFAPSPGFHGTTRFEYTITDDANLTATGNVAVTVRTPASTAAPTSSPAPAPAPAATSSPAPATTSSAQLASTGAPSALGAWLIAAASIVLAGAVLLTSAALRRRRLAATES
jgi:uncharacterized repeat protein (TIGR01451 family)